MIAMRVLGFVFGVFIFVSCAKAQPEVDWQHYGGSLGGTRYSVAEKINASNVTNLEEAWRFRTGDATDGEGYFGRRSSFKATPILVDNKLVFSTGFNRVFAVDPATGTEIWRFDPQVDFSIQYSEMFTSRGVAAWIDSENLDRKCARSVFLGTLDARLIAIDADTGTRCTEFGKAGEVDLSKGVRNFRRGEYSVTSPPVVVNNVVIVGSSVGDNGGVSLDAGVVRGFDARTGVLLWLWDPLPRKNTSPGAETWQAGHAGRTGAANVWTAMAADAGRDLVFLPTSSPSPDFFGGKRLGNGKHANSIVALRARTGELVWSYQIVRHDLWDYDIASQPMLIDIDTGGKKRPALLQATKMGFVFVLDRETGEPLSKVEERPVPLSDVPGEQAATHQKLPTIQLHPITSDLQRWRYSDAHAETCDEMLSGLRYDGIFTPPSLEGTLLYPGNPGGVNWGSMAFDPQSNYAFVAINRLPTAIKLIPRKDFRKEAQTGFFNGVEAQFTAQSGTPYGMARFDVYDRKTGLSCFAGPWATLAAVDMASGKIAWERPAGDAPILELDTPASNWGYHVNGGPITIAGGLAFLATPFDSKLRAYDIRTGKVEWSADLPAEAHATPMSYEHDGTQFVVIAAGGSLANGAGRGDFLIAFALAK